MTLKDKADVTNQDVPVIVYPVRRAIAILFH